MNKQKIAQRIKALLEMTVANGASEAEALFAAKKADDLMRQYQMSLDEAGLIAEGFCSQSVNTFEIDGKKSMAEYKIKPLICTAVEKLCGVKIWGERGSGLTIVFGLRSDVEYAVWLVETLSSNCWLNSRKFVAQLAPALRKDSRIQHRAFVSGYVSALHTRIDEMVAEKKEDKLSDGKSLVLVKQDVVGVRLEQMGMTFKFSNRSRKIDRNASEAGFAAGTSAQIGKSVSEQLKLK